MRLTIPRTRYYIEVTLFDCGEWRVAFCEHCFSMPNDPFILFMMDNAAESFAFLPKGIRLKDPYPFNEFDWLFFSFNIAFKNPFYRSKGKGCK